MHNSSTIRKPILFSLILLLAALMRLISLRDVPPGLAQDEALDAAIAMFIREGQHALFFREGYGHEPLYHYLAAPFAPLLGANVLSVRLPSVFLGLLMVALAMRWVRREFGSVPAAVTGLGLAISWWPIIFSRIGIRPILEPVLLLLAVWFWRRRPWPAGVFLGLTLYSYTAARVLFLIPLLFFLYLVLRRRMTASPVNAVTPLQLSKPLSPLIVLAAVLLLALPLYLTLRADPTLQQRVDQLIGPVEALMQGDVRPILDATLSTAGVFTFTGDPRWTYTVPGRPLFDPLTSLLFYGGLLLVLSRAWRQPKYAFILIWLAVTLIPSAVTPDAPSTIRLVGAMPVVYLLPGLAVDWLVRFRVPKFAFSRFAAYTLPLALTLLFALNLARTIQDGFIRWTAATETHLNYQKALLDIARHRQSNPAGTPVIADTFYEPIDQESLALILGRDLPVRWVQGGGAVVFPAGGNGRFYVPEFAPPDAALFEAAGLHAIPPFQSETQPVFAVFPLPPIPAVPAITPTVTFDEALTLLGYEPLPHQSGEPLGLLTYWQVEPSPTAAPDFSPDLPWDLAIFVHLLGPDGAIVAQSDGLDAVAATLRPGDIFIQLHTLTLPDPRLPESYTLQLGLYVRSDGRRLTHPGQPSDRLILMTDFFVDEP